MSKLTVYGRCFGCLSNRTVQINDDSPLVWIYVHSDVHEASLLSPVEPFNEASTLSLSTLAVQQILYSTEPVLASGLDREGGTVVQGRLWQLSILYLESEISHQYGKEACISV